MSGYALPWTDEEKEILSQAIAEGLTYKEIAIQKLPYRSVKAIEQRAIKLRYNLGRKRSPYARGVGTPRVQHGNTGAAQRVIAKRSGTTAALPKRPKVKLSPLLIDGERVTILKARDNHCRYIESDKLGAMEICANQVVEGKSWCPFHLDVIYARPQ